jgi:hypothetical protein
MPLIDVIRVDVTFTGDGLNDNSNLIVRIEQPRYGTNIADLNRGGNADDNATIQMLLNNHGKTDLNTLAFPTIYYEITSGNNDRCHGQARVEFICEGGLTVTADGGGFDIANYGGQSSSTRNYIPILNGAIQPKSALPKD